MNTDVVESEVHGLEHFAGREGRSCSEAGRSDDDDDDEGEEGDDIDEGDDDVW